VQRGGTARLTAALAVTLGVAAACWVIAIRRMSGLYMGVSARLGSFGSFTVSWAVMMAAMMLPGAAPAAVLRAPGQRPAPGRTAVRRVVPRRLGGRGPRGVRAGPAARDGRGRRRAIAAGGYELTPVKRRCRRMCEGAVRSGWGFGLSCAGSSAGLMLMQVRAGVMSVAWMAVIAVLVLAQKLLSAKAAIDVPVALAFTGLGTWIVLAPWSVPGLTPGM
jgi:predicted metal-binding membrane protein